jgi:hypothetical protein
VARIKGVPSAQAGLYVKITCHFTRPSMPGSPGETERMIEPLEISAHVPVLFKGYGLAVRAGWADRMRPGPATARDGPMAAGPGSGRPARAAAARCPPSS